jgi:hypothetical protein
MWNKPGWSQTKISRRVCNVLDTSSNMYTNMDHFKILWLYYNMPVKAYTWIHWKNSVFSCWIIRTNSYPNNALQTQPPVWHCLRPPVATRHRMTHYGIHWELVFSNVPAIKSYTRLSLNPFRSYVEPRPTLWSSCFRGFSWSVTLSNPIFLPPAYSPALIDFGRERGWWVTCNYHTVLKDKNINRKSTTCAICWLKSVLHEEKRREQEN